MNSLVFIPFFLIISLFFFIIPIAIGVFVYKDAEGRGMNGLIWALIVVFVPSFIGLIVYVLIRESQSGYICGNCHAPVKDNQDFCPNCGTSLQSRYDVTHENSADSNEGRIRRETSQQKMTPIFLALLLMVVGFILIIVFFGLFARRGFNFPEQFMWKFRF